MKKIKILITIIIFILSFPIHFIYNIFPNFITSIFFPLNESIFEHMKIIYTSILISSIIEYLIYKYKNIKVNNFIISIPIIITTIGIITHKIDYGYQAGYVTCPSCYTNLEEYSKEHETKIYATYALGSYLEYLGLKPYIDPRAEVFLKSQNEKEDIFIELYNFQNSIIPKEEFIKKYNFTHILIDYTDLLFQYNEIEGYTQIDGNEKYVKLYIRNDLIEQKKEG